MHAVREADDRAGVFEATGVDAARIAELARLFGARRSVALPGGISAQHAGATAAVALLNQAGGAIGDTVRLSPALGSAVEGSFRSIVDLTARMEAGRVCQLLLPGPMAVLSSVFAQAIDGSPAVVLLAPVVFEAADALGANPRSLMMGVTLAASMAFMTPFGHKVNLLVMGAGGYRSSDYLRIGTPLTIVLLALIVVLVPLFFPL